MVDIAQVVVNNTEYNFADDTKVPYDLLQDTVGFTSKNLLPFPYRDGAVKTHQGITYTVQSDGSIKANGTATGLSQYFFDILADKKLNFLAGQEVILSGGHSNDKRLEYWVNNVVTIKSTGDEVEGTLVNLDNVSDYNFGIKINAGQTCNDEIFYPMIRKADIMDSTYEKPSSKPVSQYIEDRIKATVGFSAKNVLFPSSQIIDQQTDSGITYTLRSDGSVSATGTATKQAWMVLYDRNASNDKSKFSDLFYRKLENNKYILTGSIDSARKLRYKYTKNNSNYYEDVPVDGLILHDIEYAQQILVEISNGTAANNAVFYPMIRRIEDLSPDYEPYYAPMTSYVDKRLRDTLGVTGKNLIPYPLISHVDSNKTTEGITFRQEANGSLIANGTSTANAWYHFINDQVFDLEKGVYTLSGCPVGGGGGTYELQLRARVTQGQVSDNDLVISEYGKGKTFIYDPSKYATLMIGFCVRSGQTVNNLIVTPMLRKADIIDDTFETYNQFSNAYEYAQDIVRDTVGFVKRNLIPYPYEHTTKTQDGITWTDNGDGSITVNGTNTRNSDNDFHVSVWRGFNKNNLPYATILSGTPVNRGDTFMSFRIGNKSTGVYKAGLRELGNGIGVPALNDDEDGSITIVVPANKTVNNVTYWPMLRRIEDKDDTYENYSSPYVVSEQTNNILGAKNLLLYSQQVDKSTDDGITPTFNSDGTVTVNGTASKQAWCVLMNLSTGLGNALKEYAGKSVIFNGGINENMYVSIKFRQASGDTATMKNSYGNDVAWVVPEGIENYKDVQVLYTIASGTVCNNKIFKPMLRLASVKDGTYAPPSLSNNNITKQLAIEYLASNGWTINKLGLEYGDNFKNKITSNDVRVVRYGKLITVISDSNFSEEITTGAWENGVYVKNLPKPAKILFLPGIFGYIADPSNMIGLQLYERSGVMQLEFVKSYTIPSGSRVRFNFTYIANI